MPLQNLVYKLFDCPLGSNPETGVEKEMHSIKCDQGGYLVMGD